jgi:TolB-like protein/tetratricopeptide (TPR) repeat protein
VLPFENMGGDETTARLADGVTEDIITDLSHFRDLNVIARNSTFRYKGNAADMQEVGRELKVRYALEGSIQRQGDRIRVTAQLIDTETAAHVWSERWDRPAADVFAVQTEVAEKVAGTIAGDLTMGQITRAELQRAKRKRPSDLQAYDLFLLGEESKATYLHIPEGIDYLTRAIALDPHLARAYAIRAFLYYFMIWQGADPVEMTAKMVTDAEEAVRLDPRDASSLATLGYARGLERRWDDAVSLLDAAVELNPSNSHVLATVATGLAYVGQAERGSVYGDRAFLLDPRMTPANLNGIKDAYFMAKRYADTVMAVTRMPEESRGRDAWAFLAIAQAKLGNEEQAAAARAKLLAAFPNASAERMLNEDYTFGTQAAEDLFMEGFRSGGLPACLTADELKAFPKPYRRADCDAERATAAVPRS